ncbi:MAG: fatty acid desaturase [Ignavibacteriales bacterium]|nr:MAG: fatty acid desaturase [Ignavibacteriales bacterium]
MGVIYAITIIVLWFVHLVYIFLEVRTDFMSPLFYAHIILQTYLFTGLFITAHDSMHGSISTNKKLNTLIGVISSFLFAGLSYKRLLDNHKLHHRYPGTEKDPDYSTRTQNLFYWWVIFLSHYVSLIQIIIMAIVFNILKLFADEISIISFWVAPAILSTIQLFYFGTYKPHMEPHDEKMKPHNARTLKRNHIWAMLSCYFFGYHLEHHESPSTPWWKMYRLKKN